MKFLDEYRDPVVAKRLIERIHRHGRSKWTIMEVCGGQTHGLLKYGIDTELHEVVDLVHGPGCPVCVTPAHDIDFAIELALRDRVCVTSFGDMLRVPGSQRSLQDARSQGGSVKPVYSPLDAVTFAKNNPDQQVVFFAVGFETTAPATALAIKQADRDRIDNFSVLVSHVRVQPAMEAIMHSTNHIRAFLAAGHVCAVTGFASYEPFVAQFRVPVVVTGFEPLDLLRGILSCVEQLEKGECRVENQYARAVQRDGNQTAVEIVNDVYRPCDRNWRGIGLIEDGGLELQSTWKQFDARRRFAATSLPVIDHPKCVSGEVLAGVTRPTDCPCFGTECTPDNPLGAPMVSSEGACAAYFLYADKQRQ